MLREAHVDHVPVFGICFGGAACAAHGGSVSRSAAPELGWVEIESDDESLVPAESGFNGITTAGSYQAATELARATPTRRRPSSLAGISPYSSIPR